MKTLVLLTLLQLASAGTDAYYTKRGVDFRKFNPSTGQTFVGTELNPIARPFVKSTGGLVAYFSVTTGVKLTLVYKLHKHHNKLEKLIAVGGIADNLGGTLTSVNPIVQKENK